MSKDGELRRIVRPELEGIIEEGIRAAQEREALEHLQIADLDVAQELVRKECVKASGRKKKGTNNETEISL